MKKVLAAITFGALLVGGFVFADHPVETSSELEPPILKQSNSPADLM